MKVYDISQEILSSNVYPGDPEPEIIKLYDMNKGDLYNLSAFSMCAHNGTHIDAPAHFIKNGKTVEEIPLDKFVGNCFVAEINGDVTETSAINILNKANEMDAGERILIKGKATVTLDAAKVFAENKIKLIGNESQSVGPLEAPMAVHLTLLNAEIVLLEGVVLNEVKEGKYFLNAAPLNLKNFEGSPCRAYLIEY
ncbi:MAG: cyclase family protein [Ruminococcaceae bacterium]|nr:cyclase family protein [Oscillospiraceae bacterium]